MNDVELGPLEMEVLGAFERGAPASVADIQAKIGRAGRDLAYTTIMTVLSRLHEKGVLTRKREGKRYLYAPSAKTGRLVGRMVGRIHRALFESTRMDPLAALLDEDTLSTDELRTLRRLVDAKLKERGR